MLVDSSVWIDYFNGKLTPQTDYLHSSLGTQLIVIGDLILAEVLQGFREEKDFTAARNALLRFQVFEMVGQAMALRSAQNFRSLRKRGVTVRKTIDCLIATFCIEHNLELLHTDQDFDSFEQHLGLRVIRP